MKKNIANSDIFSIYKDSDEQVIIKVKENLTPLDVAEHPFIRGDLSYITITKGKDHTLTEVFSNGLTNTFDWGSKGYTCINDSLTRLKESCIQFCQENGILLEIKTTEPALKWHILFNTNYKKWQATYKQTEHIFREDIEDALKMANYIADCYGYGIESFYQDSKFPSWNVELLPPVKTSVKNSNPDKINKAHFVEDTTSSNESPTTDNEVYVLTLDSSGPDTFQDYTRSFAKRQDAINALCECFEQELENSSVPYQERNKLRKDFLNDLKKGKLFYVVESYEDDFYYYGFVTKTKVE